jgi:hypothetical protein
MKRPKKASKLPSPRDDLYTGQSNTLIRIPSRTLRYFFMRRESACTSSDPCGFTCRSLAAGRGNCRAHRAAKKAICVAEEHGADVN